MIKRVLSIASGKGGVGKSTVTANLACALAASGHKVGILDADIYGPSIPLLFDCIDTEVELEPETQQMLPQIRNGIKLNSIGFLVNSDTPMVWRGPMVSDALKQLFNRTNWGELDYLLIDLPPGTGDIQLTLAQKIPVTASLIVTTPHKIAEQDVQKAIRMFIKLSVPILGVIENMSGNNNYSAGKSLADKFNLPILAHLTRDVAIEQQSDTGVLNSKCRSDYIALASRVHELCGKLTTTKLEFPKIMVKTI